MAALSISKAWDETAEFVKREARLLFPVAFMLVALPVALMEALTPVPPAPGRPPEPGLWLLLVPFVLLVTMIGNIAISYLALRPGVSVAEAIGRGARRFVMLMAAFLLLALAGAILFFILAMVAAVMVPGAMSADSAGSPTPQLAGATLLLVALMLPLLFYFGARLMLMTPAAAAEEVGPIGLIVRSWRLTAGSVWKLIGFLILIALLVGILSTVVQIIGGLFFALVAGPPEPGSLSALLVTTLMAGVNTVVAVCLTSLIARMYTQLAGSAPSDVFA
ncbi:MAG TPA: glycerophosphoryl diester phosphodiesterase membrane domain-containing protein [Allosphingosinicella sp.]|jgi:hypothetical protein